MTVLTPPLEDDEAFEWQGDGSERHSPARSLDMEISFQEHQQSDRPLEMRRQGQGAYSSTTTARARPRSRSPYSRTFSSAEPATTHLTSTPMARARSLPTVGPSGNLRTPPSHSPIRPSSPLRSPAPTRAFPRRSFDDPYINSSSFSSFMDIESIAEDSELHIPPRHQGGDSDLHTPPDLMTSPPHGHTFPRSSSSGRRRPASPLYQLSHSTLPPSSSIPNSSANMASSPSATPPPLSATKFNEPYPSTQPLALSITTSVSSTPTSLRSRSPSISSLETIPDSPDAEQAAAEAFNLAKLKAAADAADAEEHENGPKMPNPGGLHSAGSLMMGGPIKDKRKRWSVCGGERRGDFEMETIWED